MLASITVQKFQNALVTTKHILILDEVTGFTMGSTAMNRNVVVASPIAVQIPYCFTVFNFELNPGFLMISSITVQNFLKGSCDF